MKHTEPPRPSHCEKCGCPNFSYDSRPPAWQFIVLQYVGIWLCIKCIDADDTHSDDLPTPPPAKQTKPAPAKQPPAPVEEQPRPASKAVKAGTQLTIF